jgi:hypothetical protein
VIAAIYARKSTDQTVAIHSISSTKQRGMGMKRCLLMLLAGSLVVFATADRVRAQAGRPPYCMGKAGTIYASPRQSEITIRRRGAVMVTLTIPADVFVGVCYDRVGKTGELTGNLILRAGLRADVAPTGRFTPDDFMRNAPLHLEVVDAEVVASAIDPLAIQ